MQRCCCISKIKSIFICFEILMHRLFNFLAFPKVRKNYTGRFSCLLNIMMLQNIFVMHAVATRACKLPFTLILNTQYLKDLLSAYTQKFLNPKIVTSWFDKRKNRQNTERYICCIYEWKAMSSMHYHFQRSYVISCIFEF